MTRDIEQQSAPLGRPALLNLGDLAASLRAHVVLYAVIEILFIFTGVAYLYLASPLYRSEIVVLPIGDDETNSTLSRLAGQFGGLASIAGVNLPTNPSATANLAVLRSKDLTARYIESRQLLPTLFADDWDSATNSWQSDAPTLEDGIEYFDEQVRSIFEDQDTGLVVVRVEWTDPETAAMWATDLVALANQQLRERAIAEARASLAYLQKELETTATVGVQDAIYSMMEAEMQKVMLANVRPEYAFRVIDPARIADEDDPIWPSAIIVLAAALLAGLGLILVVSVITAKPRERS